MTEIDEIYNDLEKFTLKGMEETAKSMKEDLINFIREKIYGSYDPTIYRRTYDLLNSIQIEPVKKRRGVYSFKIYVSDTQHIMSDWGEEEKTLDEILDFFAEGEGFRRDSSIDTWGYAEEQWVNSTKIVEMVLKYIDENF